MRRGTYVDDDEASLVVWDVEGARPGIGTGV